MSFFINLSIFSSRLFYCNFSRFIQPSLKMESSEPQVWVKAVSPEGPQRGADSCGVARFPLEMLDSWTSNPNNAVHA